MESDHRRSSPLRRRERASSPQRQQQVDYGQDAEKTYRHIARTKQLTTFAGEAGTSRKWSWVLRSLVHHRSHRGHGCPVDVLDTVVYGADGAPESVFYTNEGKVSHKAIGEDEGCIALAKAIAIHLRPPKRYLGALAAAQESIGAVAFTPAGEAIGVKTADIEKIRKGQATAPTGTEALVLMVPTKSACAELLLSVQHTFALEPGSAKAVQLSYRLAVVKGVPQRVPCKSSTVNRLLERACKAVVEWIEAYGGGRVLRLVLEFAEDMLGDLWLVRSSECSTTHTIRTYSRQHRSPSPGQSKAARLETAKAVANELSILRYGYGIGESAPSLTDTAATEASRGPNPLGTSLGSPTSWHRPYTAMSPAEIGSKDSQDAVDGEEWGFGKSESPGGSVNALRPQTTSGVAAARANEGRRTRKEAANDVLFRGFAAPGEHDPRVVGRTAAAGRALGSSQLGGMCHGDFCDVELLDKIQQHAKFEREETGKATLSLTTSTSTDSGVCADSNNTGAFRKRLLQLDETTLQDHGVWPQPSGGGGAPGRAAATVASAANGGKRGGKRKGRCARRKGRENAGGGNKTEDSERESGAEWSEIPFSWVIRGRQERHLIDQQLRRYRRGDDEAFVNHLSGLGESSISFGAAYPATYYQPVRVCRNCYRVYTTVDAARTKSVRRLDSRAAAARGEGSSGPAGPAGRVRQGQPATKRARVRSTEGRAREASSGVVDPSSLTKGDAVTFGVHDSVGLGWSGGSGEGERGNNLSMESHALMRAQAAIDGLSRGDVCELRSFSKPPAAVNMVVAALMILLTGDGEPSASGWLTAKRFMTNVDMLFVAIAGLDLDNLRASQVRKLEAYVRNSAFRPEIIACVSLPASKLCAWVLGILEAHRWRTGRGHPRASLLEAWPSRQRGGVCGPHGMDSTNIDAWGANLAHSFKTTDTSAALLPTPVPPCSLLPQPFALRGARPSGGTCPTFDTRPSASSRDAGTLGPAVFPFPSATTAQNSRRYYQQMSPSQSPGSQGGHMFRSRDPKQPTLPHAWVPAGAGSGASGSIGPSNRAGPAPVLGTAISGANANGGKGEVNTANNGKQGGERQVTAGTTRSGRAAARGRQSRTADRLADATAAPPDPAGFERSEFLCADGVTLIPFAVAGKAEIGKGPPRVALQTEGKGEQAVDKGAGEETTTVSPVLSFVAVHDFFDTLEKTFLLFKPLILRHPGCQLLCFNSPGQAGTRLPPESERLLTNDWVADRLDELMQHVDNMGLMPLSDRPFHLVGIGNGGSIAASFACRHASRPRWKPTLRALACINGFATVDAQLAAVLHSVQGALRCFPPERPDLPVTFWSSDEYLKTVGSDLALSIFCAVANPLAAEGMLRIVKGTLGSRDLRKDLPSVPLPLVLIQSTDNLLVNAANVDPFLEGRRSRHVWSHQLRLRATPSGSTTATTSTTERRNSAGEGTSSKADAAGLAGGAQGEGVNQDLSRPDHTSYQPSCLGPAGERSLFESLSAGRDGAFVAWVKGGHEVRQECKKAVTDILGLLVAPRGQNESYFRRGPLPQRILGTGNKGRVGIAAKETGPTTTQIRNAPLSSNGALAETISRTAERVTDDIGTEGHVGTVEWENDVVNIDVQKKGRPLSGGQQCGGHRDILIGGDRLQGLTGTDRDGDGRGQGGGHQTEGAAPAAAAASPAVQQQRGTPKCGYSSLRKIQAHKSLPEIPMRADRRAFSNPISAPITGSRNDNGGRSSSTSRVTTPPAREQQAYRQRGLRDCRPGSESAALRHVQGDCSESSPIGELLKSGNDDTDRLGWEKSERLDALSAVVAPLEETIADFDVALRDHRKRRGRSSWAMVPSPGDGDPAIPTLNSDGLLSDFEVTQVDNPPSMWFGGEATTTWTALAVDSGGEKRDTLLPEQSCWTEHAGQEITGTGEGGERVEKAVIGARTECTNILLTHAPGSSPEVVDIGPSVEIGVAIEATAVLGLATTPTSAGVHNHDEITATTVTSVVPGRDAAVNQLGTSKQTLLPGHGSHGVTETERRVLNESISEEGQANDGSAVATAATNMTTYQNVSDNGVATIPIIAPAAAAAMESPDPVSTKEQRDAGNWMTAAGMRTGKSLTNNVSSAPLHPSPLTVAKAEAQLLEKVTEMQSNRLTSEQENRRGLEAERARRLGEEQAKRATEFADEDQHMLAEESRRLAEVRKQVDLGRLQQGAQFEEIDEALIRAGVAGSIMSAAATPPGVSVGSSAPVRGMRPQHYEEVEELPAGVKLAARHTPAESVLDELEDLAARARASGGGPRIEDFERAEHQQQVRQVERLGKLRGYTDEERNRMNLAMTMRLQMFARGVIARQRSARLRAANSNIKERTSATVAMQALVRGHLSRNRVRRIREQALDEAVLGGRATTIQRVYRGRLGRGLYLHRLQEARCRVLQKATRGFLGRRVAGRKRALLARFAARASCATKLQSAWRGKVARDAYLRIRCSWLASREIQRVYRGHIGKRASRRRREWQAAGPGAERLKLGMRMIEDTKVAFEKQQGEIAALNRAQEKAEARVSSIHHQLTTSEAELSVLEGEMSEVDHLERELVQLTHERDLITRGITGATGLRKTGEARDDGRGGGGGGGGEGGPTVSLGARKAEAYALEMQVQLKRAEREQRRHQLSAEFASTFADVADKKRQLDRLSAAVADIEATRQRKSREFGQMQRNLMELLSEQKRELDHVREKGVQLETAAATSAAAAAATAQRARDHEAKASAMYGQTEELMKFQFMSMSLSYFSSLNMMKQMRDINADTTTAAVAGSADAAAAAAASAAAASIPSLKQTQHLGGDAVSQALAARQVRVDSTRKEIEEAEKSQLHPFPSELSLWTVDDVCRWLDTLQLGEYKQAFREGKVDGSFLAELRESDLVDSIGMEHPLHLKKLILSRKKLMPLSAEEVSKASSVRREESAMATREGIPDIETAFSQARHGKRKRLEESLNVGFGIEAEDENGNTLLLAAVQQLQIAVVEFLVQRGANVNHRNAVGNTALHFAMSFDTSGQMGEFLINNGADDSIENKAGCSPYDGI